MNNKYTIRFQRILCEPQTIAVRFLDTPQLSLLPVSLQQTSSRRVAALSFRAWSSGARYMGMGVVRRYCLPEGTGCTWTPAGNVSLASSMLRNGTTKHFSPTCKTEARVLVNIHELVSKETDGSYFYPVHKMLRICPRTSGLVLSFGSSRVSKKDVILESVLLACSMLLRVEHQPQESAGWLPFHETHAHAK